jgi:vancomycin resistance protein VanW
MAAGKAANLKLAAAALDGIVVEPGETLSFWFLVGEPSRARGFEKGMELRSGCVVPTVGGGLCQLASAVFELGLRTGLTVVERHAHSLEIAPEPDRIRPFGATASVLYPYRDVQLKNELDRAVIVGARLERDELVVGAYGRGERAEVIDLEERGYRRWRQAGRLFRGGELWQIARDRRTRVVSWEQRVLAAETPVLEQMPQSHCYTCDRACPNAIPRDDPEARAVRLEMGSGQ